MYDRLINLIGLDNFNKLSSTTVCVIGIGGVGGYACESLVRSGIGTIIIVDNDTISKSNLNRQIISNYDNIGNKKVIEMEKRIKNISNTKVIKLDMFVDENNIEKLFSYKFDYLIDACDTINTKKFLISKCIEKNIPFISCMGTGNKLNPLSYQITDIRKTSYDPIAKIIRKYVKDNNIKDKVMVLWSNEEAIKTKSNNISSICYMPSIAGNLCASYIINLIISTNDYIDK